MGQQRGHGWQRGLCRGRGVASSYLALSAPPPLPPVHHNVLVKVHSAPSYSIVVFLLPPQEAVKARRPYNPGGSVFTFCGVGRLGGIGGREVLSQWEQSAQVGESVVDVQKQQKQFQLH